MAMQVGLHKRGVNNTVKSREKETLQIDTLSETRIKLIEKKYGGWTRIELEYFTAPFYYYGDITREYTKGDIVDIHYYFKSYFNYKYICVTEISHTVLDYRDKSLKYKSI